MQRTIDRAPQILMDSPGNVPGCTAQSTSAVRCLFSEAPKMTWQPYLRHMVSGIQDPNFPVTLMVTPVLRAETRLR